MHFQCSNTQWHSMQLHAELHWKFRRKNILFWLETRASAFKLIFLPPSKKRIQHGVQGNHYAWKLARSFRIRSAQVWQFTKNFSSHHFQTAASLALHCEMGTSNASNATNANCIIVQSKRERKRIWRLSGSAVSYWYRRILLQCDMLGAITRLPAARFLTH